MADLSDSRILAQLEDEALDGEIQTEYRGEVAPEQEVQADDNIAPSELKPSTDRAAVMEPPVPSRKRGLVAVTKKSAAGPPAACGTSAPNKTDDNTAAQAEAAAAGPPNKESSPKKPAAATKANPAPRKAAPDAKAPAELKKKAAKAANDNSGPKVKRAKSAYVFFCADRRSTVKGEHPDLTKGEINKQLAQMWKDLPIDEKAPFEARANEDKERAGNERREAKVAGPDTEKGPPAAWEAPTAGRSSKPKQPHAKSAYQLFCNSKRPEVKAANPGADFQALSALLGAAWKAASDDDKAPFLARNQELKAQLQADIPKAVGSKKAVRKAPPPATAAKSASSTALYCQSSPDDVGQSSGHAEESAVAGAVVKEPAAEATAAKGKAKTAAQKKAAPASSPARVAAAASAQCGDDDEDSIEQELINVNWEAHPAEYIIAETFHSKYLIKRKGLDFSACGLLDAKAAKRQRLAPPPDQAAESACPVSVAMMDDFDAFNRSFACAVHAHSDSGELDLDDLNQESPLEMCSLLGILREPHFPLSRVADKNKDVMIKVPMMGVSRAVQRVVCLERSAAQARARQLQAELAVKEDAIAQLTAQLKGAKGKAVLATSAAAEE